jgi:hypothetical protein
MNLENGVASINEEGTATVQLNGRVARNVAESTAMLAIQYRAKRCLMPTTIERIEKVQTDSAHVMHRTVEGDAHAPPAG